MRPLRPCGGMLSGVVWLQPIFSEVFQIAGLIEEDRSHRNAFGLEPQHDFLHRLLVFLKRGVAFGPLGEIRLAIEDAKGDFAYPLSHSDVSYLRLRHESRFHGSSHYGSHLPGLGSH